MNTSNIGPQGPVKLHLTQSANPSFSETEIKVTKSQKNQDIPSVASQHTIIPPLKERAIKIKDLASVKHSDQEMMEEIEQQTKVLEDLIEPKRKSVNTLVKERMNQELEKIMAKDKKIEAIEDGFKKVEGAIQIPTEILHVGVLEPYSYVVEPFLPMQEKHKAAIHKMVMPVEITRTVLSGIEVIGEGAALIGWAIQYQLAKSLLTEKKIQLKQNPHDEELKNVVAKLRHYLAGQGESLKDKIVNFFSSFSYLILTTTSFILEALEFIAPLAKASVGWAICLLDVVAETISLWRAQKAKTKHEVWMQQVAKNQRTLEQAQELLSKRQERMILKKAEKFTFIDMKKTLLEKGIDLDELKIDNSETFKAKLDDPMFKKELMKKFIDAEDEKEDTINVMTRNGVQALAEAKFKNEKKFFNFNLLKSKIGLTLACLSSAIAITLEVLALVGIIAASASTLAIPGLGFFVLGLVLTGVGLYIFYKYKPNLFKCLIQGVNLRLAFYQLPAKIRALQLSMNKVKLRKMEITNVKYELLKGLLIKEKVLTLANCPKEFKPILEKLQKRTAKKIENFEHLGLKEQLQKMAEELELRQQLHRKRMEMEEAKKEELTKKIESWIGENGRIKKLQDKLKEAGNKDFAIANNLLKTAQGKKLSIPMVIVEKIFDPNFDFSFDEETLKILKDKMNIDISQMAVIIDQENRAELMEKNKEIIIDKLKEFFKMDDEELLTFMGTRLEELQAEKYVKLLAGKVA